MNNINSSAFIPILGSFVADAAALGLHWLYDLNQLQKVSGNQPEFRNPDSQTYQGVSGYFAHSHKIKGDLSHYGESLLLYLKSFHANNNSLNIKYHQKIYCDYFGAGGKYTGYIDNAMRITLENLANFGKDYLDESGANDKQISALVSFPIIAQLNLEFHDKLLLLTNAIKITNNNSRAIEYGEFLLKLFTIYQQYNDKVFAIKQSCDALPNFAKFNEIITYSTLDIVEAANHFGNACNLDESIPLLLYIWLITNSYTSAIKKNIYAGGDSCGRGIILGFLAGYEYGIGGEQGIPFSYIGQINKLQEIILAL